MDKKIKCRNADGQEFETTADQLSFRPSVYGLAIKDGKVLLSKQWDGYDFPGGGINLGETIEEGLIREFKEETGLDIKVGKLITCKDSFFKWRTREKYVQCILIYYFCEIVGGEFSLERLDEREKEYVSLPEWVALEDIEKIKLYNSIDSVELIRESVKNI